MRGVAALLGLAVTLLPAACGAPPVTQHALVLADRGATPEALALLRQHLESNPEDVEARRLLVRLLGLAGDLGAAGREAEVLAEHLGAGNPTPWLELGAAYELARRYEEALALYDRAAREAPHDARGPRTGGLRAARWGERELAVPRLREALRREPGSGATWHALGVVLLESGDLAGARAAYRRGLAVDPSALENRLGLATVAVLVGDPASALREYDALLAARPRFADAHLGRAWALYELGRRSEAARALDAAERAGADPVALARQRARLAREPAPRR